MTNHYLEKNIIFHGICVFSSAQIKCFAHLSETLYKGKIVLNHDS